MRNLIGTVLIAGLFAGVGVAPSHADGFDPLQPCDEVLEDADQTTLAMVGAWSFGFLASKQSDPRPVNLENVATILRNIDKACADKKPMSLLELIRGSTKAPAEKPGSEAQARALLMRFFEPDADLVALTAAILPTEAEVHMVYKDPLASLMAESYAAQLKPGIKFGPKPEHNDLLLIYATTAILQRGDAVLREFPGGYKDVVQYFKADVPIVRFKFVTSGQTIGLAFDGLVYVNDHWVIMPKPWRALP